MAKDYRATYRKAAKAYLADHDGRLVSDPSADPGPGRWSDAWLLMAIKYSQRDGEPASLEDIYACGDGLNHAIFMDSELSGGFLRLSAGGFIDIQGTECSMTAKGREAWQAAKIDKKGSNHKRRQAVANMLGVPATSS